MKLFSYTTRTSILTLCLALLTLFVWQQQSGWFKAPANPVTAAAPVSGSMQMLTVAEQVPEGLQRDDWNSIRRAYEKQRHAVVAVADKQQARNPGQQWRTRFDGRGFAVTPDQGAWTWGLELDSYGFAAAPRAISGQARVTAEGQRVVYQWDETLEEWYVNDQRGLEHGFTLKARPAPADEAAAGPLELRLRVRGELRAQVTADGQGVSFVQPGCGAVINYSGLKVWDADGKTVAAQFAPVTEAGDTLRLTVEESGARYPLMIDPIAQQAYLKASNTGTGDHFGRSVAVAGDTAVVGAPFEDSNATGVNGDGTNNSASDAGAAYVFVRSGTTWTQQAYLKASNTGANDRFGYSVAVAGDTLVVGAFGEASNAIGVNGNGTDDSASSSGAAYVFVRSGGMWSQQAYLKASNTGGSDLFGHSVAVAGDTVVVGAFQESSNATGVNGDGADNSINASGAAYVFVRSGTMWSQQAYLKASNPDESDSFGVQVAVAGDTVVVAAYREGSNATGVNGDGMNNLAYDAGAAYVFVRNGTTWTQQAYLKAGNTGANDRFGWSVALAGDTAVVGAYHEDSNATGVNGDGMDNSASNAGAAYVFVRSGTTWSQQAYLKAGNTGAGDTFGNSVAVAGDTVMVGAPGEDSNATGVNGDGTNNSASSSGASYVFVRSGTTWNQQDYLKANNTVASDQFGWSVAVAGDTVVVGANQEDNSASNSGAAYVFNGNAPSTITEALGVTRAAGAAASNSQIATVNDGEDAENTLAVLVNDAAMATVNGVTVSNIAVSAAGLVTADVAANCTATTAMFTLKVTDSGGLTATATLTVTVTPDNMPPTIAACPANITTNTATDSCAATVTFIAPTASDNCAGATVTCTPASGSSFAKGVTTVTCTPKDAANNTGTACSFTVTVNDTQAPAITCPANIFAGTAGNSATVTYPAPIVGDNCSGVGVPTCTPASGSSFNVGVTTVNCSVADAANNSASCSFTVTVNKVGGTATDPLLCTGPGNTVQATLVITNNGNVNQTVSDTTTFTNLVGVPNTCTVSPNVGTCTVTN
ncbi:MAG: HYR domain-containing protein, partial [Blastocatellia bacterium]